MTAIHERIAAAARRASRDPAEVQCVVVTKTHPVETIQQLLAAGVTHLGENRIQEAAHKIDALAHAREHITWHLIGHVQRNKAKNAVGLFDIIHSLDSVRLAETLDQQYAKRVQAAHPAVSASSVSDSRLPVLLQVNVSGEASKEGFSLPGGVENQAALASLLADIEHILALPHLHVQGLMTVAPFVDDETVVRSTFRSLRLLRDHLAQYFPQAAWDTLSMGMTDDFELAIEEGATVVRIGRAVLGERPVG
jgi:hypothetical protein